MRDKTVISNLRPADILLAGVLLTRLPLPRLAEDQFARSATATWAYPIIGAVLGCLGAFVWMICAWLGLSANVTAGIALIAMILMTGALHEDGLADTADGLWGGTTAARRLEIMKDSRIGAYGVIALIFGIGLRWAALVAAGPMALFISATLSRAVLPGMMALVPFARDSGLAHSVGRAPKACAVVALALGLGIAILWGGILTGLGACAMALIAAFGLQLLARAKINGITGDILGATQQVAEILVLLFLIT